MTRKHCLKVAIINGYYLVDCCVGSERVHFIKGN